MALRLRKFEPHDIPQVVEMYIDFIKTIYPNRKIGGEWFFYKAVMAWVDMNKHIYVTENDAIITGFTLSSVDYNSYLTEPVYFGEIAYVRPEFRKGRSAYMLYHNVVNIADSLTLKLTANAFLSENKVDKIQTKLGGKPTFIVMERS